MSPSKAKATAFQVDQHVVYPLQGVGLIKKIDNRPFEGKPVPHYTIYIEVSDMTVMLPCSKAEERGIRAIVSKKESDKALDLIGQDYEPVPSDWKLRYQMNLDLLKQGSIQDIATVVRTLYHRSKVKELPILERKLFDSALRLLIDEVAYSQKKDKADVEKLIFSRLSK